MKKGNTHMGGTGRCYINFGLLSAKRGDLKRACRIRPRKQLANEYQHKVETGCYVEKHLHGL